MNNNIINHPEEFTSKELEDVTSVFKSLETGLRQGTIFPKVSLGVRSDVSVLITSFVTLK